ncbi:serine/threonine protein kinase [Sphaerisporangium album]|uniref:non-specific serine/threonine protein kinase n=1 Tax=Sphaerisporangium album TaxID=509200 RepID=A0A367FI90_9ACTN|nr:serine/threonine-protein kinase [Sphaerisporangium album]RCG30014.1 serine/threonine protein kinase [Sphaerisporangium album]
MGTPGQLVVKRYRLMRALGQGGMGMVWEGHDTLLDRPVAIKEVLIPDTLTSRQRLSMIQSTAREARMAARLNHRNIVSVFDVADEDGRPWIIMELVPSRSLDRVIAGEGTLSVTRAATIATEVLTALSVAHAAGIVHRDVKPANILIGYDGRVVLSDFGIATSTSPGDPRAPRGGATGSPGFLAPERAGGTPAGPASDLWSLGATLFATVVGKPPFEGTRGALSTLLTQDAELAKAPEELRAVLAGLLATDPARRMGPTEAKRLLDALVSPAAGAAPVRRAGRRGRVLAVVAAATAAAVAIGGWAVLRPADPANAGPVGAPTPAAPTTAAAPSPSLTPAAAPVRLKLKWYDNGRGWKAGVPRGWRLSIQEDYYTWSEPEGIAHLGLEVIPTLGRKPADLLAEVEASLSRSVRKYHRVRLGKVPSRRGAVVAEWESTWTGPGYHSWAVRGVAYRELQRMIVTGDRISVIDWSVTASQWERLRPTMESVFKYYRPPGTNG